MKNKRDRKRSKEDNRFHKLRRQTKIHSTFDPKIHKMSSHGLGYQMKDNIKTDPKESSGAVLKNILR